MKVLTLCLLIFASLLSHAQSNFVAGLIFQKSGDTLSGSIDNKDWKQNPNVIKYKNSDGLVREFRPRDIDGFYFTETKEWYKSAILGLDKSSIRESDLLASIKQRGVSADTVFLRVLVSGRLSLYYLLDEFSRGHYVAGKQGEIKELWLQKKLVMNPGPVVVSINHYKSQLSAYSADCATPPATEVDYKEKPLIDFVLKYNNCFSNGQNYVAEVKKVEHAFSVLAGINLTYLTLVGGGYLAPGSYKGGITPVGGISYEAIMPKNRKAISIYCELVYRSYSIEDKLEASQLKLMTMVRYRFPVKGQLRPFVGGGITNALAVGTTKPTVESGRFRPYEQGIGVDGGVLAGRLAGWVRYERANGFSPGAAVGTKFNNWYVSVAYRLL